MQKIVVHRPSGHDGLKWEEHPDLQPSAGEVVISVVASSVNYADVAVRMGLYSSAKKYVGWPITPGFEVAGRIAHVGPGVTRWKDGDEVIGVTRFFAYATQVNTAEHFVFAIPPG
jgi:NADPH:quinone reductase-like Zn-dependent oxidoreductase